MQSVPITTDVLIRISIRAGCTTLCDKEKFVSDSWQVGGFLFGVTQPGFELTIYRTGFELTIYRTGFELTIYRTRGEHANHYTTDAVTMAKRKRTKHNTKLKTEQHEPQ